jgi:outer membrane lipoprotein SlyB
MTLLAIRTPVIALAAAAMTLAGCNDLGLGSASSRDDGYVLGSNDNIYRDDSGNYYCRKPDGTRGAVIGGLAGGVLGNIIAPGGSKTLGTIIGAAGGAVAGRAIERGEVRCR